MTKWFNNWLARISQHLGIDENEFRWRALVTTSVVFLLILFFIWLKIAADMHMYRTA